MLGQILFDVGANIGYTAAVFSNMVGAGGKVLAIEPSPVSFRLLNRSLSESETISLLNIGVYSEAGTLPLYVPEQLDVASVNPIPGAEIVEVGVTTIDDLVEQYGSPQFIKIDTEGHEAFVLRGAQRVLASNMPPIVVFEVLTEEALRACLMELPENVYEVFRITNSGKLVEVNSDGSSDCIALPSWANSRIEDIRFSS